MCACNLAVQYLHEDIYTFSHLILYFFYTPHFHTLHKVKIIQIDLPLYTTQSWLITQICTIEEIEINPCYYRTKTHERIQRWFLFFLPDNFTLGILNKIPMKASNIMFGLQEGTKVRAVSKGWSSTSNRFMAFFNVHTWTWRSVFFSYHNMTAASKLSFTSESGNYH